MALETNVFLWEQRGKSRKSMVGYFAFFGKIGAKRSRSVRNEVIINFLPQKVLRMECPLLTTCSSRKNLRLQWYKSLSCAIGSSSECDTFE